MYTRKFKLSFVFEMEKEKAKILFSLVFAISPLFPSDVMRRRKFSHNNSPKNYSRLMHAIQEPLILNLINFKRMSFVSKVVHLVIFN